MKCLDTETEESVAICALLHDVCKGEIVKEIKKELGITEYSYYHFSTKTDKPEEKPKPQVDFERMKRLDTVYRAFLGKLFLARIHKQD